MRASWSFSFSLKRRFTPAFWWTASWMYLGIRRSSCEWGEAEIGVLRLVTDYSRIALALGIFYSVLHQWLTKECAHKFALAPLYSIQRRQSTQWNSYGFMKERHDRNKRGDNTHKPWFGQVSLPLTDELSQCQRQDALSIPPPWRASPPRGFRVVTFEHARRFARFCQCFSERDSGRTSWVASLSRALLHYKINS